MSELTPEEKKKRRNEQIRIARAKRFEDPVYKAEQLRKNAERTARLRAKKIAADPDYLRKEAEYNKKYRAKNSEALRQQNKEYHAQHREKRNAATRAWKEAHPKESAPNSNIVAPEIKLKIVELRKQGIEQAEIAKQLGIKTTTVTYVCHQADIILTKEQRSARTWGDTDLQRLKDLRKEHPDWTRRQLSQATGFSVPTIKRILALAGPDAALSPEQIQINARAARTVNAEERLLQRYGGKSWQEVMSLLASRRGGKVLGQYQDHKVKLEFECQEGHKFFVVPNGIQQGQWCARCANVGPSKAQLEISEYVKSLGIKVVDGDRSVIKPLEIDIYCPEIGLAIEYNGLYWHSSAVLKERGRHFRKWQALNTAGIDLFAIFQDEWIVKRDLIQAMIRQRVGKSSAHRIYARDLEFRRIARDVAVEFFERNHLDGAGAFFDAYGLFDGDRLIMAAATRTNFNGEFELARMATDYDFAVPGGASKLLTHIGRPIISFSNNRLSNGNVYSKLGGKLIQVNSPSYWYTDGTARIWRWKCRRINTPEILARYPTEELQALNGVFSKKEFGDDRKLFRIEDYGHQKWELDLKIPR